MKRLVLIASIITLALCFTGCKKEVSVQPDTEPDEIIVETGVIEAEPEMIIEEDNDEVILVEEEAGVAEEEFEDGIVIEAEGEE